ncbi:MAG: Glu/Leu/Phe/Val dehydrogenase [Candidatus Omnitrophica bacterium]|nr:Glu/Leu/Phe/Val dehydrogenase [Candidatus Omnitrophota bacterium]
MEPLQKLGPVFYREVEDETTGLKGYLVVDRYLGGAGTGGIRLAPNISLVEVANLAYEMTLKFSFLNIRKGGAKAGFVLPGELSKSQKEALCRKFGEKIGDMLKSKKYFPGEDMGIDSDDLKVILSGAGIEKKSQKTSLKGEYFTALSVFLTAQEILKNEGKSFDQARIIIEGFGKVGGEAARLFSRAGAIITGISTIRGGIFDEAGLDIPRLIDLKKLYGDGCIDHYELAQKVSKEELLFKEADIVIPGARPDVITKDNVGRLKTKIIVPIANIAVTEEIENMLAQRNIKYVPGFVSNCGGILGYFLGEQGFDADAIEKIFHNGFSRKVRMLLKKAQKENISIAHAARAIARRNFELMSDKGKNSLFKKMNLGRIGYVACKKLKKKNIHIGTTFVMRAYMEKVLLNQ